MGLVCHVLRHPCHLRPVESLALQLVDSQHDLFRSSEGTCRKLEIRSCQTVDQFATSRHFRGNVFQDVSIKCFLPIVRCCDLFIPELTVILLTLGGFPVSAVRSSGKNQHVPFGVGTRLQVSGSSKNELHTSQSTHHRRQRLHPGLFSRSSHFLGDCLLT